MAHRALMSPLFSNGDHHRGNYYTTVERKHDVPALCCISHKKVMTSKSCAPSYLRQSHTQRYFPAISTTLKRKRRRRHRTAKKEQIRQVQTEKKKKVPKVSFEHYVNGLRKDNPPKNKKQSNKSTPKHSFPSPILPPHLDNLFSNRSSPSFQKSFQTQSFAPNQVYANTINININNDASNNMKCGENENENYWKQKLSFPKALDKDGFNALNSYRLETKTTQQKQVQNEQNLSISDWIVQYEQDKKEFASLHTFSRYKLNDLNNLFHSRRVCINTARYGTPTTPAHIAKKNELFTNQQIFDHRLNSAKTITDKIITGTSMKSALCIDLLAQISKQSDFKYAELLSLITTELSKIIFHRPPLCSQQKGESLRSSTLSQSVRASMMTNVDEYFDDFENLTLSKLCGLRSYKEKYRQMAVTVGDVQSDFKKLSVNKKWVKSSKRKKKDIKIRNRMFKIWRINCKRRKIAHIVAKKLAKYLSPLKDVFNKWKNVTHKNNAIHMKRRMCFAEGVSVKQKAQIEYYQAVESGIKKRAKKLKTAMSIMAEHLYCEETDVCQQRTAYRIHQMMSKMRLAMPDEANSFFRQMHLNEYLKDFPTAFELSTKFSGCTI